MKNTFRILSLALLVSASVAHAYQPIIRPYEGIRGLGMGGVRTSTGLYEQNWYGNPARSAANPKWRFGLIDPMVEVSASALSNVSELTGEGSQFEQLAGTAGKNNHGRFQMSFPSFYWPNVGGGKWSYSFALLTSVQGDMALLSTYNVDVKTIADVGPSMTIARKLLAEDALTVGLTTHLKYRMQVADFSIFDLIGGTGFDAATKGSQGGLVDFDIGGTYKLPIPELIGFTFEGAASINNLLGGKYKSSMLSLSDTITKQAPAQPRTYNFGVSAKRATAWAFSDLVVALEMNDFGNNGGGSLFRTVHLGSEARWALLAIRAGINQGYIAAGLGIDLKILTLDFATYGEELGLNVGDRQDRRYAFKLALQI